LFLAAFSLASVAQFSGLPQEQQRVSTRFGPLSVGKDRMLMFKGQKLDPPIEGNNSLNLGVPFRIGSNDVALIVDNGGTACPSLYYLVTVNKDGAKATKAFGTCSELETIKRTGDSISISMRGFKGPFEPASERRKASREHHVFVFRNGIVTESGKPIE
jgi:hypothetical protein